jgi:hypothetical protein
MCNTFAIVLPFSLQHSFLYSKTLPSNPAPLDKSGAGLFWERHQAYHKFWATMWLAPPGESSDV